MPTAKKSQTGQAALQDADDDGPLDGGPADRRETIQKLALLLVLEGQVIKDAGQQPVAVHEEEKHGVEHDEEHEQEINGSQGTGAQVADQILAQGSYELTGLAQDGLFVDDDLIDIGDAVQISGKNSGFGKEFFDRRLHRLADRNGLGGDDADQDTEGDQHDDDDQQQRGQGGHRPTTPK